MTTETHAEVQVVNNQNCPLVNPHNTKFKVSCLWNKKKTFEVLETLKHFSSFIHTDYTNFISTL